MIAQGLSSGFAGVPPHARGQRIGLFGGSFDPPHEGHRATSLVALRRLRLDAVWWLVSPGNPLKDHSALPPLDARMAAARRVAAHPRIAVSGLERGLGSSFTCDIVAALTRRCPGVRFVWIMGSDAFADLHRWRRWRLIAATLPLGVVDRPGSTLSAASGHAAGALRAARLREVDAALLPGAAPPAYVFLHGKRSPLSSTGLRAARRGRSADEPPTTSL